jgi:hypothetical protein
VPGARRIGIEQRQLVAQQVVDVGVRLCGVEEAADRVARAGRGVERGAVVAQARIAGDRLRRGHRQQLAAALVQHEIEAEERL